jgi:hypothetical protein
MDNQKDEYGNVVSHRGRAIAPGVVCKCPEPFCPMHGRCRCPDDCPEHGKLDKGELRKGRKVRYPYGS